MGLVLSMNKTDYEVSQGPKPNSRPVFCISRAHFELRGDMHILQIVDESQGVAFTMICPKERKHLFDCRSGNFPIDIGKAPVWSYSFSFGLLLLTSVYHSVMFPDLETHCRFNVTTASVLMHRLKECPDHLICAIRVNKNDFSMAVYRLFPMTDNIPETAAGKTPLASFYLIPVKHYMGGETMDFNPNHCLHADLQICTYTPGEDKLRWFCNSATTDLDAVYILPDITRFYDHPAFTKLYMQVPHAIIDSMHVFAPIKENAPFCLQPDEVNELGNKVTIYYPGLQQPLKLRVYESLLDALQRPQKMAKVMKLEEPDVLSLVDDSDNSTTSSKDDSCFDVSLDACNADKKWFQFLNDKGIRSFLPWEVQEERLTSAYIVRINFDGEDAKPFFRFRYSALSMEIKQGVEVCFNAAKLAALEIVIPYIEARLTFEHACYETHQEEAICWL